METWRTWQEVHSDPEIIEIIQKSTEALQKVSFKGKGKSKGKSKD